jgi:hypothetical protein
MPVGDIDLTYVANREPMRENMLFDELLEEPDYAKQRNISLRSAQRERAQRIGPAYIRLGRKIFYRKEAIREWLMAQEQTQPRARRHGEKK